MQSDSKIADRDTDVADDKLVGVPAHPVAALVGAVAMGAGTGAVVGTAAGPVGTAVGALVGAIVGGFGGDAVASSVSEAQDTEHWREQYVNRPYVKPGSTFDDFGPAYAYGETSRQRHGDRPFDDVSTQLGQEWETSRGQSNLGWDEAQPAARDAWERSASIGRDGTRQG